MTAALQRPRPRAGKPAPEGVSVEELEQFYTRFFLPLTRRAVRRYGLSMEDAADIVQDAFVLAITKLDRAGNPKAWLYQVVDHLAVNWQRKAYRRAHLLARWGSHEDPVRPGRVHGVAHH